MMMNNNLMKRCSTVKKYSLMKKTTKEQVKREALKKKCKRVVKASMKKLKTVARMMRKVTRENIQ